MEDQRPESEARGADSATWLNPTTSQFDLVESWWYSKVLVRTMRLRPWQVGISAFAAYYVIPMIFSAFEGVLISPGKHKITVFLGYPGPMTPPAQEVLTTFIIPDMFTRVARGAPIEDTMSWGVGEIRRIYARHKAV